MYSTFDIIYIYITYIFLNIFVFHSSTNSGYVKWSQHFEHVNSFYSYNHPVS